MCADFAAGLRRQQRGGPYTVPRIAPRCFNSLIVEEVLRIAVEHHCFLSQYEVTSSYRGSQEEEVACSQDTCTETKAGTASRIDDLEEPFAKFCEEQEQVVATLSVYQVAKKIGSRNGQKRSSQ